jgi:hypothetical protein
LHSRGWDTVELSNDAYEVAAFFYWRGELEPARRLNRIAAAFPNGSSASLTAAQRLRIMDRDFTGALQIAQQRSERYGDEFAFRDYITLLYALGERRLAAATFDTVALNPDGPGAWQAALFGQRLLGLKDIDLPSWIRDRVTHSNDPHAFRYGAQFAIMWNSLDRLPPSELPDLVRELAHDPIGRADGGGSSYPSLNQPGHSSWVQRSAFRRDSRQSVPDNTPVESDLTLFARAYVALRHEKFADAVRLFDDLEDRFPVETYIDGASAPYALPYFAYASAKTGDPLGLETYLGSIPEGARAFDYYLAKAFFAASRGEREAAMRNVKEAYNNMPLPSGRPVFVDYQFIEACEWIAAEMPDARFRSLVLDFAKRYQVVNPFRAWPYAVQARYDSDALERERALGMAVYLDPESLRLKEFSAAEISKARQWAQDAHPFGTILPSTDGERL